MSKFSAMTTASCLAILLGSNTAFADVSAEDAWADWKNYFTRMGGKVNAVESASGIGINVSDMSVTMSMPEENSEVVMNMGTLGFIERGDGTVEIKMQDSWSIDFQVAPEGEDAVKGQFVVAQTNPSMIVSENDGLTQYDFGADTMDLGMDGLTVNGEAVGPEVFSFGIVLNALSSTTTTGEEDGRTSYDQSFDSGDISYSVVFDDPEGEGKLDLKGTANTLGFSGDGFLPDNPSTQNASAMIAAGLSFLAKYQIQGGASQMTFDGPDGSGTINSTSQAVEFDVGISETGVFYAAEQLGATVNMLVETVPIPISFSAERAATQFLLPAVKSDEAQDMSMLMSLEGVAVSDSLWGMVDPTGQLPRDPATITLDLSGKAKLLFDYLDPAQAAVIEQSGAAPGELESLKLNTLLLELAGARLAGSGGFVFDNSDTITFGGLPRPQGAVDLTLDGANGLMDKLVAMGLLPEEQAMGARMMMGLFARPGAGPDQLTSKIEINEQGHVLANGQRIQ